MEAAAPSGVGTHDVFLNFTTNNQRSFHLFHP